MPSSFLEYYNRKLQNDTATDWKKTSTAPANLTASPQKKRR